MDVSDVQGDVLDEQDLSVQRAILRSRSSPSVKGFLHPADEEDPRGDVDEQHLAVQRAVPYLSQVEEASATCSILTSRSSPSVKGFVRPAEEDPPILVGSKSVPSVNALADGTRPLRPHVPLAEPSQELGALYASESAQVSR